MGDSERKSSEGGSRWRGAGGRLGGLPIWLLLIFSLFLMMSLQSIASEGATHRVRYDELRRYVEEGRVNWVHLKPTEIQGGYERGREPEAAPEARPAAREGTEPQRVRFVTGRVEDESLVPLLEEKGVAYRAVSDSGFAGNWPWMLYLGVTFVFMFFLLGSAMRMRGQQGGVLAFGKSKGRLVVDSEVGVDFSDVAGVEEAKEELQEIIDFLKSPAKYKRIGARIPKGVLLVGPPGTGKTLLAKAVAGQAGVPFISINGSEFVEMFVGVGAARVRDLFEQAASAAPCIVFIAELHALGRSRGGAALGGGSNEEREQTLNQLLVEMDGFESNESVILMAATNRPEILDPALMRPGRFDRQVLVDRPDRVGRRQILEVHSRKVRLDPSVDLETIAARTPGFAGADLANLVNEAALLAAREDRETVKVEDFSNAVDRVIAGLEKKSRIISEDERRRVAYHEVGHALAGTLVGTDDRVHKISIIPRGMGALGYTMQLPTEERYLMTASQIEAKLVGLLGGRAAEELVFGEASTGAQDDLRKATDIARAMVVEYGLTEAIGPVSLGNERPSFLGGGAPGFGPVMGEQLTNAIDAEIRRIVEGAKREASRLIGAHRPDLERITERLLELEVLEGEELDALLEEAREGSAS